MRTSVISRRSSAPRRAPAGFSLLELMVVLSLLGLIAALAAPNLQRLYGSLTRATERDYILDQIADLGAEALLRGRDYVVLGSVDTGEEAGEGAEEGAVVLVPPVGYEAYPLEVPAGWRVRLEQPIFVHANGVCLGGAVTLLHEESTPIRLELRPPFCRVDADA